MCGHGIGLHVDKRYIIIIKMIVGILHRSGVLTRVYQAMRML